MMNRFRRRDRKQWQPTLLYVSSNGVKNAGDCWVDQHLPTRRLLEEPLTPGQSDELQRKMNQREKTASHFQSAIQDGSDLHQTFERIRKILR